MDELTLSDLLLIVFLPYSWIGYVLLCLLYAPIEIVLDLLKCWSLNINKSNRYGVNGYEEDRA